MNSYNTDVVICGGGISGLIMAKSLIHLGLRVTCIEKNKGQKQRAEQQEQGRRGAEQRGAESPLLYLRAARQ